MVIFDYKNSKIRVGTSLSSFFRTFYRTFYRTSVISSSEMAVYRKLGSERVSEMAIFRKLGSVRVFRAFSELVPSREYSFRLENRPESSVKSSECRALGSSNLTRVNFKHYII